MNELIMLHGAIALLCLLLGLHFLLSPHGRPWPLRLTALTYLLYGSQSLLLVLSMQHIQLFSAQAMLRPVGALLLAPLFWCFFQVLQRPDAKLQPLDLVHLIPAALTVYLLQTGSILLDYLDIFLLLSYAAYLTAVGITISQHPARLDSLGDAAPVARRYLQLQGALLAANLVVETALYIELQQGRTLATANLLLPAAALFLLLHLLTLLFALQRSPLLEWLYQRRTQQLDHIDNTKNLSALQSAALTTNSDSLAMTATPALQTNQAPMHVPVTDEKLQNLYHRWLDLLEQQQLYQLEFGITLAQAARKLQVPARQLSQAINQCYGASFSALLNDRRITEARQLLLKTPPMSVTEVMHQAGFATKSNFHKEFVRVTGMTPSAYRASAATQSD